MLHSLLIYQDSSLLRLLYLKATLMVMQLSNLLVIFSTLSFLFSYSPNRADAIFQYEINTFPVSTEDRQGKKSGASVVYACESGKETGPCVDSPSLCTTQGGKFVGYCFVEGKYEGVCCTGLDPANSVLTSKPSHIEFDNSTTTAATTTTQPSTTRRPLFPSFPSPTTQAPNVSTTHQTLFPTLTTSQTNSSQTFSPNFTLTTQSMNSTSSYTLFPNLTISTQNSTFPNFTYTTVQMNFTSNFTTNFTLTTLPMPNITLPSTNATNNTEATPSPDTSATTEMTSSSESPSSTTIILETTTPTSEATTEITVVATESSTQPSSTAETTTPSSEETTEITVGTTETTSTAATTATEITTESSSTIETTTEESPPPSPALDVPAEGSTSCGTVTFAIQSEFRNPSYPGFDSDSTAYEYSVIAAEGYCALRIEFVETVLAGKGTEGCSTDSITIINSGDSPTTPICGLLHGYQYTVRQDQGNSVKILVTTQSTAYLWNLRVTQVLCSSLKPYHEYQNRDNCGVKNPKQPPAGVFSQNEVNEPRYVSPLKLLKSKSKTFVDVVLQIPQPSNFLQNSILNRDTSIKIVKGNETAVNEWPWQALILLHGKPLCGASIINEEWIITAGLSHVQNLKYPLLSVLTVDIGDHDLRTRKETKNSIVRVSKIVPNIQNEGVKNDIALIKLASKLQFGKTVRPVCLPQSTSNLYTDQMGITTGWGRTEDSVISPVLREARVPILSNLNCRQKWSSEVGDGASRIIEDGMICAGGEDVGPCNGDTGGPLVVQDGNDKWNLVGLTSFGLIRGCAIPGVPSVFTRITSYLNWIGLNMVTS